MDDGRRAARPVLPPVRQARPAGAPAPASAREPGRRLTFPVIPEFLKKANQTPAEGGKENE
jgi:hypothetical protein